ncbi:hypothetical protein A2U01_0038097, partial [Trifolium medium]|nr:hypothetical protein [Trifolium medium]
DDNDLDNDENARRRRDETARKRRPVTDGEGEGGGRWNT